MVLDGLYLTNEKGQPTAAKDKAAGLFKSTISHCHRINGAHTEAVSVFLPE
jgi:hypothetical protein